MEIYYFGILFGMNYWFGDTSSTDEIIGQGSYVGNGPISGGGMFYCAYVGRQIFELVFRHYAFAKITIMQKLYIYGIFQRK